MSSDLKGLVVWITGASSGIGAATAREAASRGAALILSGRRTEALAEVARDCESRNASTALLPFDLLDPAALAAACAKAPALLGPIDVLVLNAGVSQRSSFLDTAPEAFDRVMDLDFGAQVDMLRRCLPAMVLRGRGSVVAISSFIGLAGMPLRPAYSAAKHALTGLFQNLRAELAGTGLKIVTVYPGFVRTAVGLNALDGAGRPVGVEDPDIEGGVDPEPVARRILDAALRGPCEVKIGFDLKMRLGLFLSRRLPGLYAKMSADFAGATAAGALASAERSSR
jgi:dehydrogenase/reductase SDR family protein 7B